MTRAIAIALYLLTTTASASHIAGADLTYKCSNGLYTFQLDVYRDCDGLPTIVPPYLTLSGPCGNYTLPLCLALQYEVTTWCGGSMPTQCTGFPEIPGYMLQRYTSTQFALPCSGVWYARYLTRGDYRNSAIVNLQAPSLQRMAIEAMINTDAGCHDSPYFLTDMPIPFVCEPFTYHMMPTGPGIVTAAHIGARSGGDNPPVSNIPGCNNGMEAPWGYVGPLNILNHVTPWFSPGVPITGFTYTTGGSLYATPQYQGAYAIAVRLTQTIGGQVTGWMERDFQIRVVPCELVDLMCVVLGMQPPQVMEPPEYVEPEAPKRRFDILGRLTHDP